MAEVQEELAMLQQGTMKVTECFTKIKTPWNELVPFRPLATTELNCVSCGGANLLRYHENVDQVIRFLCSLNDSFAQARSQIMLCRPLPKINYVFAMVVQQERQMASNIPTRDVFVLVNQASYRGGQFGGRFGGRFGRGGGRNNRQRPLCTYYGQLGHMIDKCYKKHCYPIGFQSTSDQQAHSVTSSNNPD